MLAFSCGRAISWSCGTKLRGAILGAGKYRGLFLGPRSGVISDVKNRKCGLRSGEVLCGGAIDMIAWVES